MTEQTNLINVEQLTAIEVFEKAGKVDEILANIREAAISIVPDVTTKKGQAEIKSLANKVARSKTFLDNLGKDHVSHLKAQAKVIDNQRKTIRDTLDELKAEVRKPLTEIEEREEARRLLHSGKIAQIRDAVDGVDYFNKDQIASAYNVVKSAFDGHDFEEWLKSATEAKDIAEFKLDKRLKEIEAQEEAERIEREERERKIAEEAAAKAEAEKAAAIEREKAAKKAAEEAEARRIEQEKAAKAEAERAEIRRIEAERKAEEERKRREAEHVAEMERMKAEQERIAKQREVEAAERAQRQEQERIEAQKRQEAEEKAKREANKKHIGMIRKQAKESLMQLGIDEDTAKNIVLAINAGSIANVTINY